MNLKAPNIVVVVDDVWGGSCNQFASSEWSPEGIAGIGAGGRSSSKQSRPKKSRVRSHNPNPEARLSHCLRTSRAWMPRPSP